MPLFRIDKERLVPVGEIKLDLEASLQRLVEKSIKDVFGYIFVASEYSIGGLRIDSLAYDQENKAFVIIEYKRDRSFSVIDQGFNYLSVVGNRKSDLYLELVEKTGIKISRGEIDWSMTKVIFVASSFTPHQRGAIGFKGLPIELWEVKKYANNTIIFNQVIAAESTDLASSVKKEQRMGKVASEYRQYTVDDHCKPGWAKARELYELLRDRIIALDPRIVENPKRAYIGFKLGTSNVVAVHIYKTKVVMAIGRTKPTDLKDPEKRLVYRKNSMKHYNQDISDVNISKADDVDYAMRLFKQAYENLQKSPGGKS